MSQYIAVFIWLAISLILYVSTTPFRTVNLYGNTIRQTDAWFAFMVIIPLIYWAGVRPSGVFDTGLYARTFHDLPGSFSALIVQIPEFNKDRGYYTLASLIHIIFGDSTVAYFTVIASIQGFFLYRMLRKYSTDYLLSIFIFVASTDYLSWMHNGIRQFLAVTIILAATDFIVEKKYVPTIIVILVASLFHGSAILMIPIIFLVQGKPWNKKTVLMLIVVVIAILYVDRFTELLDVLLEDTQYTNVVSDWKSWEDNGTNPLRVLVYSIPMLLSIIGYKYIRIENNLVINIAANMSIATTAMYLVSMFTSGIFIGRLPIYTSIYSTCILLPWEIEHMFTEQSAKLVKLFLIGAYTIFYCYQCHFIWGIV